ncbi:hypothetical protein QBE54_08045 [Thermatribacter velox]|uniref:Uncharacterized protein n=1 Tax=Thermatribacter velox TaxID=3039681 RepID=A0ABZ2Y952_9BACT
MNAIDLNSLGNQGLEAQKNNEWNLLKIVFPDEALYIEIMLSGSYPKNQFLRTCLNASRFPPTLTSK